jgi:hypothetical protein
VLCTSDSTSWWTGSISESGDANPEHRSSGPMGELWLPLCDRCWHRAPAAPPVSVQGRAPSFSRYVRFMAGRLRRSCFIRPDGWIRQRSCVDLKQLLGAIPRRDKTEWMTCRVGEDPRAVGPRLIVELRPTQGEHGSLGRVEVVDPKMEVKLHGRSRIPAELAFDLMLDGRSGPERDCRRVA